MRSIYLVVLEAIVTMNNSNKRQELTHDEPLLDLTQAGMREEEARQVVQLKFC
jgi:hypothetical protein